MIPIRNIPIFLVNINHQLPTPIINTNIKPNNKLMLVYDIDKPFTSSHLVAISIIGGKIKAKQLLESAPTSDMNSSNLGIAAANRTNNKRYKVI